LDGPETTIGGDLPKTGSQLYQTLGASHTRILRQLLTESVLLSVLGGVLGILFAYWGTHAIISFVSNNQSQPLGFVATIDIQVLGFTFGVSLLTGFSLASLQRYVPFVRIWLQHLRAVDEAQEIQKIPPESGSASAMDWSWVKWRLLSFF
jgi:Sec-independent protein secretion pathway component TatC